MKHIIPLILALATTSARADVADAVDDYILPGYTAFADAAAVLRDRAANDCAAQSLTQPWHDTFDAWLQVSHLRFGPVEQDGRAVIIAYWPDARGAGPRALATLIADQDPVIATPQGTAQLSAAARGIYALEYLLFDPQFEQAGEYGCTLVRALTADLAHLSANVLTDWEQGYADTLRTAGAPENLTYLTKREGVQALYTALQSGLEFDIEQRLGRPLGTFERPRPTRAESWRSKRGQRNLMGSLHGLQTLKNTLSDAPTPVTDAAFAKLFKELSQLDDPAFQGVDDPQGRFKIEIIQQAVRAVKDAAEVELSDLLGVDAGFNAADGD